MVLDEEHLAWMEERFTRAASSARCPRRTASRRCSPRARASSTNNHGSAPGIWLEDERGRWVAMLPGVPREMRGMLADTLLPLIARAPRQASGASCARARCARPASASRSSPTASRRSPAASATSGSRICRTPRAPISASRCAARRRTTPTRRLAASRRATALGRRRRGLRRGRRRSRRGRARSLPRARPHDRGRRELHGRPARRAAHGDPRLERRRARRRDRVRERGEGASCSA